MYLEVIFGQHRVNNYIVLESFNLRTYGFRAFSHAPQQVRFATSLFSFKNQLKTYLFEKAYEL